MLPVPHCLHTPLLRPSPPPLCPCLHTPLLPPFPSQVVRRLGPQWRRQSVRAILANTPFLRGIDPRVREAVASGYLPSDTKNNDGGRKGMEGAFFV